MMHVLAVSSLRFSLEIVGIVLLLAFSAFFSAMDMTFSSISLARLKKAVKSKVRNAKLAYKYAENYEETITTLLFGNSLVNILATSLGTVLSIEIFGESSSFGPIIVSVAMLLLLLTFGEIMPKVLGRVYAYRFAIVFAPMIRFFKIIFFPLVYPSVAFAKLTTKPLLKKKDDTDVPSDDELQAMIDTIEEEGIIDEDESELISNSIEFKQTSAYEIMTPRVKIEAIPKETNLRNFFAKGKSFSHSRIPVYEKDYDHIVGYLHIKTVYRALLNGASLSIDELMLPLLAIPRTMEISSVLALMKRSHRHFALVKDEFGGNEGILTLEDILEELVGEMYDESEESVEFLRKGAKRNVYFVKGSMNIADFFSFFHLDEEKLGEDYSTISGWINDRLGRFAKQGEEFSYGKIDVKVVEATPYTVEEAKITYHPRRTKIEEE